MKRDFKGVWIVKEVWENKELTWMEKLFIVEIDSLDNKDNCFATNKYFSEFFNLSISRVSQIISSLKNKEFINIVYEKEGKQIKKRILRILKGGIQYSKGGYLENAKDNNTTTNNTKYKEDISNEKPKSQLNDEVNPENPKEEKEKKSTADLKKEKEERDKVGFDYFWKRYHEKTGNAPVNKADAFGYWVKLTLSEQRKSYSNVEIYMKSEKLKKGDKYICKARTYLSGNLFDNELSREDKEQPIPKHHYDPKTDPMNTNIIKA